MVYCLFLFHLIVIYFTQVNCEKRYENPITINDALEEIAQSQNYISTTVDIEINRIEQILHDLEHNATDVMDENEIEITMVAINSSRKIRLLTKFAAFLDIDVSDCLIDVDESLINVEKFSLEKFKQCIMSVLDETYAFVKDTTAELKNFYFITFNIATNVQNCPNLNCIEKTLLPLTQLANDAMIAINNLSGNIMDLIYHMNRSFKQCSIGHIQIGTAKIEAITNAVARCINDRVTVIE